jgi:diguanylate cyclase (GGDEF)-like protein/PAS domain S-box-containing protein
MAAIDEDRGDVMSEEANTSEAIYRALVQDGSDVVTIHDTRARCTFVSPSVERILGWTPEQFARNSTDYIHPDDLAAVKDHAIEVLSSGATMAFELRVQHADGSWRWFELRATNMADVPAVNGVMSNLRDVTERKEAEEALRVSAERFRAIVENTSDVVQIMDGEGTITWLTPTVQSMLGYSVDELIGRPGTLVLHPDEVDSTVARFRELAEGPADGSIRLEVRVRHKDGTWRWVDAVATNQRDTLGLVTSYRDITPSKLAENALRESEVRFRSVAASSPIGIYEMDATPTLRFVNERWQEITGATAIDALGGNWQRFLHEDDKALAAEQWARTGAIGRAFRGMLRLQRPEGEVRWVMAATEPIHDEDGLVIGHVGTLDDITERLSSQRSTERLSDIVEATSDLVVITDNRRRVIYMNSAARTFYDVAPDANLYNFDFRPFSPQWVQDKYSTETSKALKESGIWSGELAYYRHGVEVTVSALFLAHHDSEGRIEFVSSVTRDISENKAFERRLEYQATHDPLTGLPNRTLFLDRLELALLRAQRSGKRVAVLFCDLDNFKVVNDSLGHGAGDRLLVAHAERLRVALRPGDTVARFGGDEFVILCDELDGEANAIEIAERILESARDPLAVEATEVFGAMSIGIALSAVGTDPETMIRDADSAMYRAKAKGRARVELFDENMRATVVERLDIESALRRAIARHELRVLYQPTINLASGKVVGVEALLRWEHPERGLLAPSEFIDVAEETALIVPIGAWVIDQACRQAQRWQATLPGGHPLLVTVNISGRQLDSVALIDNVADVIARTGIEASLLGLEITESVIMRDPVASTSALQALKEIGVRIAVDDFGTGYSSLAYLRRFPVDLLKVDQAFVQGLGRDPEDSAIVAAVVSLARTLGMEAIAEGVETDAQLAELRKLGCDMAQGFFMARPMAADAVEQLLASDPVW